MPVFSGFWTAFALLAFSLSEARSINLLIISALDGTSSSNRLRSSKS
jgi:hypothetical protein